MASDLDSSSDDDQSAAAKKPAEQILKEEIQEGMDSFDRKVLPLFMSALSAGLDVGFSLFLMAVVQTMTHGKLPEPVERILVANMYAVGFIFVVIGRSELFTEQTTLAVLPVLRGKASIRDLLRVWGTVYVGNILGAALVAGMITYIAPALKVVDVAAFKEIAQRMTDHPAGVIFLSAVLAGWLMGLLSWIVVASRDTISQIFIVWLVTTAIGIGGLHHSIVGTVEVLGGVFTGQTAVGEFGKFLLWATLGNAVGGSVFVALIKYGHAKKSES